MYKWILHKNIFVGKHYASMEFGTELPFIPFIGINLYQGEWNFTPEHIWYDLQLDEFHLYELPEEAYGMEDFEIQSAQYSQWGWLVQRYGKEN